MSRGECFGVQGRPCVRAFYWAFGPATVALGEVGMSVRCAFALHGSRGGVKTLFGLPYVTVSVPVPGRVRAAYITFMGRSPYDSWN